MDWLPVSEFAIRGNEQRNTKADPPLQKPSKRFSLGALKEWGLGFLRSRGDRLALKFTQEIHQKTRPVKFNEDSRVKIPAILHLTRLEYEYLPLQGLNWEESSNIVPSVFRKSVSALNPAATPVEIENALGQLDLSLDNEDLGKQFYQWITEISGLLARVRNQ